MITTIMCSITALFSENSRPCYVFGSLLTVYLLTFQGNPHREPVKVKGSLRGTLKGEPSP